MATFVDRLLVKCGMLPKPLVTTSPAALFSSAKEANSLEHLRDIPRYPPFMEGLPIYPPSTLLATQKELVGGVRQIIANESLLTEHYTPAMMRLAALVQLLPASQAHHHRGAGGMLRHSLEVGLWALQQTEGKLIRGVVTPQQRRVIEPRWKLTVFLAGICHDLGKVVTDISVTDRANELKWRPYNQGLYDWANSHKIDNYFLHWQEGRGKKHTNVSSTLINAVIKEDTLDWISDGGTDAVIWLTESLNNNPGSTNQIHNFVVKADQLSVERDLKSMGVAMAGYEIGVPVERYLTDIMRRLVQEGIWRINEPSARIWNLEGTTYLVWPMAGDEIARRTKDEDIPGLPKTADGILDMMVEREIAFMRDGDGDPFYYISPDVITENIPDMRMKAIRLRDQALISSMPIAPISGKIHSSKTGSNAATKRADAQAELPLNSQDDCGTSVAHVEAATVETIPPQSNSSASVERLPMSEPVEAKAQSAPPPEELSPPPVVTHAQEPLTLDALDGAMGELVRVLLGEFKSGKKSFDVLGVKQADGSVYLKWPDAFSGFGFSGKQILDELSELGWLIAASDVAKVGDAEFAGGVAKSIKLSGVVGHLFGSTNDKPFPAPAPAKVDESTETVATASAPPSSFEEVFQLTEKMGPPPTAKKPRKRPSKKKADNQEASVAASPSRTTKSSSRLRIKLNQSSKGKSIVKRD
ncbi:MobH family relaxase [Devosia sp.]|uniref:MobH family relaxase n=1 Tax=Devosia sp. TaxID=1871048 RepID=UPI002733C65B|nr:MobH family relaxase [Devosia sp.]MDP2781060.1 MobH family relaxase [Devosia sp.]